jgi:hypothetical protein
MWREVRGVTLSETQTITYERPAETSPATQVGSAPSFRLPALFWAGCVVSAANVLILLVVWFSPRLQVTMYGEDTGTTPAYYRPSPFAEPVQSLAASRLRSAPKVRPVVLEQPQASAHDTWELSSLENQHAPAAKGSLAVYRGAADAGMSVGVAAQGYRQLAGY